MKNFDLDKGSIGINVSKGATTTALTAIVATTTSPAVAIGASGFKNIKLELAGSAFSSGNYSVAITGCETSGGTYGSIFRVKEDGTHVAVGAITVNSNTTAIYIITNVPAEYVKLVATRTTDGTLTAKVTPFN